MGASSSSSLNKSKLAREQDHGECETCEIVLNSKDRVLRLIKIHVQSRDYENKTEEKAADEIENVIFKALLCNAAVSEKCFCLFIEDDEDTAKKSFRLLIDSLTPFYKHFNDVYSHNVLQSLVFCILRNGSWNAVDVAQHLELTSYLSNQDFVNHSQEKGGCEHQDKDTAKQVLLESESPLDMAKQMIQGIAADFINETNPDIIPFFEQAVASAGKMGDKFRHGIDLVKEYSDSPVHLAVRVGNCGLLSDLLNKGAPDDLLCGHVFPIHLALQCDQLQSAELLLNHNKKNISLRDGKYRGTPLHWAKTSKAMEMLMQFNAEVDARNSFNETPLHIMTRRKRVSCITYLVTCGADVNATGIHGRIALHCAVQMKELLLVKALLVFGSNQHLKDDEGISARDLAEQGGEEFKEVLDALMVYSDGKEPLPPYDHSASPDRVFPGPSIMKKKTGKESVLCLDGGGIRGLISVELLMAIACECGVHLQTLFDWVSGTSTGSYLAVLIAQGASLREIHSRYFRLKQNVFSGGKPYNAETLEKLLIENFGENEKMDSIKYPRVIIPVVAADRRPAILQLIRNYDAPYSVDEGAKENNFLCLKKPCDQDIWKAIRYSSSAPSYFRPLDPYLDGGFIANNPTLDVLAEIHEYNTYQSRDARSNGRVHHFDCVKSNPNSLKSMKDVGILVSLGTGLSPQEPVPIVDLFAPSSFTDAQKVLLGVRTLGELLVDQTTCTDGHMVQRAKSWCESTGVPYFRFNPPMTSDWQLDEQDDGEIISMLFDTRKYIKHNIESIRELAKILMAR